MMTRYAWLLVWVVALAACRKEEQVIPLPPPGGGPTQPEFEGDIEGPLGLRMLFGGTTVVRVQGGSLNAYVENNGQTNAPPVPSSRYYVAGLYDAEAEEPAFAITLGTLYYEGAQVLPDAFEDFLEPGPRTFGIATTGQNAVELQFRDDAGRTWSTRCGSGTQTNASFVITDVLPGNDGLGQLRTIAASFSCTLYDCQTGTSTAVTNGLLVIEVREF